MPRPARKSSAAPADRAAAPGGIAGGMLQLALEYHQAGALEEARRLYGEVLRRDPAQADAAHLLGILEQQEGRHEHALRRFDAAIALQPDIAAFHRSRGTVLRALDRPAEALEAYRSAGLDGSADAELHCNAGLAHRALGDLHAAIGAFDHALELEPALVEALNNRGLVLQDLGLAEDALRAYEAALSHAPDSAEIECNRGLALQETGRMEAAFAAFDRAVALAPGSAAAHCNLGDALTELGRYAPAEAAFATALELRPDLAEAYCGRGIARLRAGDADGALADLMACLRRAPGDPRALAHAAGAMRRTGRHGPALDIVDTGRFPVQRQLSDTATHDGLTAFLGQVRDAVLAEPSLRWEPHGKTTRKGSQTARLSEQSGGALGELIALLRVEIDDILGSLKVVRDHPFLFRIPRRYRLSVWATVLKNGGHQLPHIHPGGWLSGVAYISVPERIADARTGRDGWIQFGIPDAGSSRMDDPDVGWFRPRPGHMLLFPSHYFHRTEPFDSRDARISVAFDIVPTTFRGR